jgi:hypothetical protein
MAQFELIESNGEDPTEKLVHILRTICVLTSTYINQSHQGKEKEIYRANIMIYIPWEDHRDIIEKLKKNEEEWIHLKTIDLERIAGVLHLVPDLMFEENPTTPDAKADKSITLPVILKSEKPLKMVNIPGAPMAFVETWYDFPDVRNYSTYNYLGDAEIEDAKNYWEKKEPNIRSFLSLAIPKKWSIEEDEPRSEKFIGVLNIDCSTPNILGTDQEYYATFMSLMYPIQCKLGMYLRAHIELYIKRLKKRLGVNTEESIEFRA